MLRKVPEVEDVVRRTGRAERTEDPMPHTISDVLVTLKNDRARDLGEIEDDMRERLEDLPGIAVLFTTPLGMRIDEGLGGTPADISVRVFGPDLEQLAKLAEEAERIMGGVAGLTDLRAEALTGLPQLQIAVDRQAAARVGLAPGDVIRAISVGLIGQEGAQVWSGQRRFDLVVRLRDDRRNSLEAIEGAADRRARRNQDAARASWPRSPRPSAPPRSAAKPAPGASPSRPRSPAATWEAPPPTSVNVSRRS